jgi:hypothetical protein
MQRTESFSGHLRPEDVRPQPYIYHPFDVPPGTTRIDVTYDYNDPAAGDFNEVPGNLLDIGIFDSRGLDFLEGNGFRGWAGAKRREFFLAPDEASPGFLRGPLTAGRWNIILGFESILEGGCRYDLRVELTIDERATNDRPRPVASSVVAGPGSANKAPTGGGWYKGDLHCHTNHSDGLNSMAEIVASALERGLDFLAITDHNTISHHEDIAKLAATVPIVLIPGEEITTYWGHANAWGLRQWVEFRCTDAQQVSTVAGFVREKGGLFSVNHPKCVGPPWLFPQAEGIPCVEVWQAPWRWFNWESRGYWDNLLCQGRRIVGVGGSDTHSVPPARQMHPHGPGEPATWVYVPGALSEGAILEAIRQGHVFLSQDAQGPLLELTADADGDGRYETLMGDAIEAKDDRVSFRVRCRDGGQRRLWLVSDGQILQILDMEREDFVHDFSLDVSGRKYVRAEVRGYRGRRERGEVVVAMTNPVYFGAKP